VALAGVRQLREDGTPVPSTGRFPSALHALADSLGLAGVPGARRILGERELDPGRYARARPCEWTSGPMLVRTAALERVGWFDQRLFHLAAEMDLCQRLRRAGWEVLYMPCLTALRHRPSEREAALLEAQSAYGRMQFARKHFPYLAADYRWALTVLYALRLARCTISRRLDGSRRQAARAALSTVLRGRVTLAEPPAL
jgi:GT2 family glycosyltransferase